jgi:ribulose-phosphate 3-epimerase
MVCAALRPLTRATIDVPLMVKPVARIVPDFARAGADIISFHPEASEHVDRTIGLIKEAGCQAGLVLNPTTPTIYLNHVLGELDLVLVMSVNPGFGGQHFIPYTLDKLRAVRSRIDASGRDVLLEVDGGVQVDKIAAVARAGADTFVAGSAIFGSPDYAATIAAMRELEGDLNRRGAEAQRGKGLGSAKWCKDLQRPAAGPSVQLIPRASAPLR